MSETSEMYDAPIPSGRLAEKLRVVHVADKIKDAVYVGRSMPRQGLAGSVLANPYRIGPDGDRAEVVARYRSRLWSRLRCGDAAVLDALIALRDVSAMSCWCRRDGEARSAANSCHADVVAEFLELFSDDDLRALGGPR